MHGTAADGNIFCELETILEKFKCTFNTDVFSDRQFSYSGMFHDFFSVEKLSAKRGGITQILNA
jgi:hypothetical protein